VFTKHNHIPSGASLIETVFPVIFDLPVSLGFVIVYSSPLEEEKIFFGQYLSYLRILPLVTVVKVWDQVKTDVEQNGYEISS